MRSVLWNVAVDGPNVNHVELITYFVYKELSSVGWYTHMRFYYYYMSAIYR